MTKYDASQRVKRLLCFKSQEDVAKEIAFYLEKEFPESWGVYKRFNENI